MKTIPLSEHVANNDPTATLITKGRSSPTIYRVHNGYVACTGQGLAIEGVFITREQAEAALEIIAK